jgi:hypothetical protein
MCNQRERLIGYLYSEDNASDRDEMQRHLDVCPDCRAEIGALKSVREDLLAWEVPAHQSVWRPFAPAPVTPWYRQVPAWGLAAAASLMLMSGFAGGAVAHVVQADPVVSPSPVSQGVVTPVSATRADLVTIDQRIAAMEQRLDGGFDTHDALLTELRVLRGENQQLVQVIGGLYADLERKSKTADFKAGSLLKNFEAVMALQVK